MLVYLGLSPNKIMWSTFFASLSCQPFLCLPCMRHPDLVSTGNTDTCSRSPERAGQLWFRADINCVVVFVFLRKFQEGQLFILHSAEFFPLRWNTETLNFRNADKRPTSRTSSRRTIWAVCAGVLPLFRVYYCEYRLWLEKNAKGVRALEWK